MIEFLRPIPSVALIPLAVLVYGSGLESKVFLAAFAVDLAAADADALRRAGRRPDRDRHGALVRLLARAAAGCA